MNPQVFGYVMEKLLEAGALDVFGTPIQMKKNRPGTLLTVLAKPEDADELTKIIFAETTTLGVRRREERRQILAREWQTVCTRFGDVRIKVASMNGTVSSYAPEYEDCRRIAADHRVPLKQVMQEAIQAYLQLSRQRIVVEPSVVGSRPVDFANDQRLTTNDDEIHAKSSTSRPRSIT